jgi:hypothetical protein
MQQLGHFGLEGTGLFAHDEELLGSKQRSALVKGSMCNFQA